MTPTMVQQIRRLAAADHPLPWPKHKNDRKAVQRLSNDNMITQIKGKGKIELTAKGIAWLQHEDNYWGHR